MKAIPHLNLYSAYSLKNKLLIITYKIDGIPFEEDNIFYELIDGKKYYFPSKCDFNSFCKFTNTKIINIQNLDLFNTFKVIISKKNMISKIDGNNYIKNFFLINSEIIFDLLDLLKQPYKSPFLNDGFIIYDLTSKYIYKHKPFCKLTLDLKKVGDNFYSGNRCLDFLNISHNNEPDGIYRCYPLYDNNWECKEFRNDKVIENPFWLVNKILFLIRNQFDYSRLKSIKLDCYYDIYKPSSELKLLLQKRKKVFYDDLNNFCDINSNILDFGCGYAKYLEHISYNKFLGVDKSLQVLNLVNNRKKATELWMDISQKFDKATQKRVFGQLWNTQIQNHNKLMYDYNVIIFNHSIHNVKNLNYVFNYIKMHYPKCFVYIGMISITESFENEYQKVEIIKEDYKQIKANFTNNWINKTLSETHYKVSYMRKILTKYNLRYLIREYDPNIKN